jgi:signal peptidase II
VTRASRRGLAALCVLLVAADWLSKLWITNRLELGQTLALVEGWFYVTHRQNTGVAFSLLSDLPAAWGSIVLSLVSLAVAALFVSLLLSTSDGLARLGIALVVAGALGNAGDRLVSGAVTDFILVSFFPYVFNVADAAINIGGALLVLRFFHIGAAPAPPQAPAGG